MKHLSKLIAILVFMTIITIFMACKDDPACIHNWGEWNLTTEDTYNTPGVETKVCLNCGDKETRSHDPYGFNGIWNSISGDAFNCNMKLLFSGYYLSTESNIYTAIGTIKITENIIEFDNPEGQDILEYTLQNSVLEILSVNYSPFSDIVGEYTK